MKGLIISIFLLALYGCFTSTKGNKVKSNTEILAIEYLFCTHCNIKERRFSKLRNEKVFNYFNNQKISNLEYNKIIKYASYQYDYYFKPLMNKTTNKFYDSVKSTTKTEFVNEKLIIYLNSREEKLKDWKLSLNKVDFISRDSIISIHDNLHNTLEPVLGYFNYVKRNNLNPIESYVPIFLYNNKGQLNNEVYYVNKDDLDYFGRKDQNVFPLVYKEVVVGFNKIRVLIRK